MFQTKTVNMLAATPIVISYIGTANVPAQPVGVCVVTCRSGECYIAPSQASPLPAATAVVAPTPGNSVPYIHLKAGEKTSFGIESPGAANSMYQELITGLLVHCVLAGELIVNAH